MSIRYVTVLAACSVLGACSSVSSNSANLTGDADEASNAAPNLLGDAEENAQMLEDKKVDSEIQKNDMLTD